jgi:hypothetical protein
MSLNCGTWFYLKAVSHVALYDSLENGLYTEMLRFSVLCISGQFMEKHMEKQSLNVSKLPVTLAAQ